MSFRIAQEAAADAVLDESPFALLVGMLLDQQFPMERAFAGPAKLKERLGSFDVQLIAEYDDEAFAAICATPPAVHRYPGSMAGRIQTIARHVMAEYDGEAARLWRDAATGKDLVARIQGLPGFGKQKAQIFTALLGKQLGVRPGGWEEAAGVYAEAGSYRSVADVVDAASLEKVRAFKKEMKAAARAAG
jgi:uncharacterized HhH-GPD family protein